MSNKLRNRLEAVAVTSALAGVAVYGCMKLTNSADTAEENRLHNDVAFAIAQYSECTPTHVQPSTDRVSQMTSGARRYILNVGYAQTGDAYSAVTEGTKFSDKRINGMGVKQLGLDESIRFKEFKDNTYGFFIQGNITGMSVIAEPRKKHQDALVKSTFDMPIRSLHKGSTHRIYADQLISGVGSPFVVSQYCGQFDITQEKKHGVDVENEYYKDPLVPETVIHKVPENPQFVTDLLSN